MLDYDAILASLCITNNVGPDELVMVAGWTYRDAGMDPVRVVVYDRLNCYPDFPDGEKTERRIVVVQGNAMVANMILDYMEGY